MASGGGVCGISMRGCGISGRGVWHQWEGCVASVGGGVAPRGRVGGCGIRGRGM